MDEQEIIYFPIDVALDTSAFMQNTVAYMCGMLGKPRNYGITKEEEEALRNAQQFEQAVFDHKEKEELALLETRELEERRKNIQQWMEKLAKVKKEEFEREESALIPLRHYLMAHIVPTLTKGLIDVTRARPEDPIDFLAEFLFQNNPGGINPAGDAFLK
jgi:adenylate kinase